MSVPRSGIVASSMGSIPWLRNLDLVLNQLVAASVPQPRAAAQNARMRSASQVNRITAGSSAPWGVILISKRFKRAKALAYP